MPQPVARIASAESGFIEPGTLARAAPVPRVVGRRRLLPSTRSGKKSEASELPGRADPAAWPPPSDWPALPDPEVPDELGAEELLELVAADELLDPEELGAEGAFESEAPAEPVEPSDAEASLEPADS